MLTGCAAAMPFGPLASQPSGSAANFCRHPGEQKWYVVPWCSNVPPRAVAGSTRIPQTGSSTRPPASA